ncbi:hypothetical protein ABNQ39_07145 [Azospirillum sp. A26]|uniref:hypothetical protein n=1 Tax=Azospirillum sp. A26 TaxID=3160607 RepID=UPI00366C82EE
MTNTQQPQALAPAYRVGFIIPEGLHPRTATLVRDFAEAMAKKLRASEVKHGWTANWMRKDWQGELAAELLRHVHKGDPIDVAAYAAFAWFHGWSVAPTSPTARITEEFCQVIREMVGVATGEDADPEFDHEAMTLVDSWQRRLRDACAPYDPYRGITLNVSATSGGQVATIIPYTDEDGKPDMADWRMIAIGRPGDTPDHVLDRIPAKAAPILCEAINARPAPAYDPLRRIDYPEGRFGPAMLDGDDEMSGKELKLIAKSHGFDLRLKVEEWDDELRDMIIDDTFGAALEAACPPQVDKDGYQLVGAWDDEEGELVLAYVRPLTKDAKPEGSANG